MGNSRNSQHRPNNIYSHTLSLHCRVNRMSCRKELQYQFVQEIFLYSSAYLDSLWWEHNSLTSEPMSIGIENSETVCGKHLSADKYSKQFWQKSTNSFICGATLHSMDHIILSKQTNKSHTIQHTSITKNAWLLCISGIRKHSKNYLKQSIINEKFTTVENNYCCSLMWLWRSPHNEVKCTRI